MSVSAVIGLSWGDEGKSKLVDYLNSNGNPTENDSKFTLCVRAQGGSNAGHTINIKDQTFKLHMIPCGILVPDMHCLIAHGCVVHPQKLLDEIKMLKSMGVENVIERLHIASSAHIVTDDWIAEDCNRDKHQEIGTTKQGIGPTYAHKMYRDGVRMEFLAQEEPWSSMMVDGIQFIMNVLGDGNKVLIEGANATLLDTDVGTYPFVTSSNTTVAGLLTGTGIPPQYIKNVFGSIKAYITRVGNGPFPTELLENSDLDHLQMIGYEYGTTTNRLRRCGWLDIPQLRYSHWINGVTHINMNKLDVLSGLETVKYCTHYKRMDSDDETDIYSVFPTDWKYVLQRYEPVYRELPGWNEDITGIRKFEDLPENAQNFITSFERDSSMYISIIGVGPERDDLIFR